MTVSPSYIRIPVVAAMALLAHTSFAKTPIADVTDTHTRVVWVQDQSEASNDTFAKGTSLRLMGLDSADDKGVHPLLSTVGNFSRPMISPDGKQVVFTIRGKSWIYAINWDGSNMRRLADGYAYDLWMDPATQLTWVIYGTQPFKAKGTTYSALKRCRLDAPKTVQPFWDARQVDADNFQVSRDGQKACGLFPWPDAGVASLTDGQWIKKGRGCWTSFSPDNSYMLSVFDGKHRNITLYPSGPEKSWSVPIDQAPGINGFEVYHPRWSNHPRFIVMTGPYMGENGNKAANNIRAGGKNVEIYLGRFSRDYRKVEKWTKLTDNKVGDFYPDAWVANGDQNSITSTLKLEVPTSAAAQQVAREKSADSLVFNWQNILQNQVKSSDGKIRRTCDVTLHGKAIFTPSKGLDVTGGSVSTKEIDDVLLAQCKKSSELTIEAVITPANLTQKGPARIISFSDSTKARNFTLGQSGPNLVLRLRTPHTGLNGSDPQLTLCPLQAERPQHVLVTYRDRTTTCYLNGKKVLDSNALQGSFSNWSSARLILGDEHGGGRNWAGQIEGIRLYSQSLTPADAAARYQSWKPKLAKRSTPSRLVIEATLDELSPTLSPKDIQPYTRCLVGYGYTVNKVISGTLKDKRIAVYHWSVLGGTLLPSRHKKGTSYTLTLEAKDDHPELKPERISETLEDLELPSYLDISPR